jgi:hypothetical protein
MALKHKKTNSVPDEGNTSLVQPSDWNDDHIVDTDGVRFQVATVNPANPIANEGKLFLFDEDSFFTPELDFFTFKRNNGRQIRLQPDGAHVMETNWYGINNFIQAIGTTATITGTATVANESATNIYTQTRKVEALVTTAATDAVAGFRSSNTSLTVGSPVDNVGGFYVEAIVGRAIGVATATSRFYAGVINSTAAPIDVEPSSLFNQISFGCDAADVNYQIMHRGTGAVTKIDLGAAFLVDVLDRSELFKVQFFSPPGTTQSVKYRVTRLSNGATATGTITTNLPSSSTYLGFRVWASVGGTSSVIGIAVNRMQSLIYV